MNLNEHVNVSTEFSAYAHRFYPDDGYALWRDDVESNLDENGQPFTYYLMMNVPNQFAETVAPHIWAKLIDETMEVYGDGNKPSVY